jgi:predicted methyltransferase
MSSQSTFDAAKYKATTRDQWDAAAEAWHRWAPTLKSWLGTATDRMLDLAGVTSGARVLDVAAGAGDQTLHIARRVGPGGTLFPYTTLFRSVMKMDFLPALKHSPTRVDRWDL